MVRLLMVLGLLTVPRAGWCQQETTSTPAPPPLAGRFHLDMDREWFRSVRDNAPFPWQLAGPRELGQDQHLRQEEFAYESVLVHAAQFDHAELMAHARRDVPFANLVGNGRGTFRGQLIALDGSLRRLVRVEASNDLKLQNVAEVFEAWVFPWGESNPICFFCTELPPGLRPMRDLQNESWDLPVSVGGYYFKLLLYEQQAFDPQQPGKHRLSVAPVLIGRSITLLPQTNVRDTWRTLFMPLVVGGLAVVASVLALLAWRYRREDRRLLSLARQRLEQNPFPANHADPGPSPSAGRE